MRLTQKGYRVLVLERGKRYRDQDFARSNWMVWKYLWAPALRCFGILQISMLKGGIVLHGCGVGGGSLGYANVLEVPDDRLFANPSWQHLADWKKVLGLHYETARAMLGVTTNPRLWAADYVLKEMAEEMGQADTFRPTEVGVFFGPEGEEVPDPYFKGKGPPRRGCTHCGACMVGCRYNGKNTLVKNYLYLAEKNGAEVHPLTTVTRVYPAKTGSGYVIETRSTKAKLGIGRTKRFTADQVIFSAASLGTQKLLHKLKRTGDLPEISPRLGELTRTNSESILGAIAPDTAIDYTEGVAITSSWHPDEHTHIEPVRYGHGSNAIAAMQTVLTEGGPHRLRRWLKEMWLQRRSLRTFYDFKHWSERTVIALVMQALDNSITTFPKRTIFGWRMSSKQGHGKPNPTWIPAGLDAVRKMAGVMSSGEKPGYAGGTIGEPFNKPMTAHFIGGCTIGDSVDAGVIDPYQRLYGYDGLHVVDGSAISANLGVNPSLTITAQAERAMAFWPNKDQADPRPKLGAGYARIQPVRPASPAVPASAPGALQLPIVDVR